ncbi:hypothetical protein B7486_60905, partial [cyanobacterium TDX16]
RGRLGDLAQDRREVVARAQRHHCSQQLAQARRPRVLPFWQLPHRWCNVVRAARGGDRGTVLPALVWRSR